MAVSIIPLSGKKEKEYIVSPDADVRFIDPFDNSIVASYSAADFANLSALPENPTHDGLISQGWNWTLADAKATVASDGMLDIGQMYATTDGSTRLYVHLDAGGLSPYVFLDMKVATFSVDWGDASTGTIEGTDTQYYRHKYATHTYAKPGDYVIKLKSVSGTAKIEGYSTGSRIMNAGASSSAVTRNAYYLSTIKRVEIGADVTLEAYAFYYCKCMESVTIPSHITSFGQYAFQDTGLLFASLPSGTTTTSQNVFSNCYYLQCVSVPKSFETYAVASLSGCRSLKRITGAMTSIPQNLCTDCYGLKSLRLPNSITSIGNGAFQNLVFNELKLPSSLQTIGNSAFTPPYYISYLEIPASVTSIGSTAFRYPYSLGIIKFLGSTPPTVANANAFGDLPTSCVIYVPTGSLSAYTGTANMPDPNTYTYVEY